jgi:hypothetical protein
VENGNCPSPPPVCSLRASRPEMEAGFEPLSRPTHFIWSAHNRADLEDFIDFRRSWE